MHLVVGLPAILDEIDDEGCNRDLHIVVVVYTRVAP